MRNREPRSKVVLSARIRFDGRWMPVTIRDLSSRGMMLSSRQPPRPGTYFEISGPTTTFVARTVWVKGERFGARIQDRIDVAGAVKSGALAACESPASDVAAVAPRKRKNPEADARRRGAAFEFGTLMIAGFTAAVVIALLLYSFLSTPFQAIALTIGAE